jgi:ubiquinone biosynthesis protein
MHVASGWVPPETRVEEFEAAIRSVCEPIFEKPLKDISFGHLLLRLFQTARRFDMAVQPQLVLLQKTLLNIEGLGRELYPELDLWQTAKPFLEKWFHERLGPKAKLKQAIKQLPEIAERFPELPGLIYKVLDDAAHGKAYVQTYNRDLQELQRQMQDNHKQTLYAIIAGAVLISAAIVWG